MACKRGEEAENRGKYLCWPAQQGIKMSQEMTIPKSRLEVSLQFVFTTIVVGFAFLGVANLCHGTALISSALWLGLVTMIVWSGSKRDGGFRKYLTNRLGELAGRRFVVSTSQAAQPGEIRFGYELLGQRVIQQSIAIGTIESIAWSTGQATGMAGRDMNDWQVCLWVDHHDPARSGKRRKLRKPDQNVYIVGPATRKERAEALGLSLVALLRGAGAKLAQGAIPTCFVRPESER